MSPLRRSAALDSRSLAQVTFCNAWFAAPLNRCALVDLKTEDLRIVDLDDWPGDIGATGMARLPNGDTIVASQGNRRLIRRRSRTSTTTPSKTPTRSRWTIGPCTSWRRHRTASSNT
jgi:hypothetical protein